jgi:hypothetical protein
LTDNLIAEANKTITLTLGSPSNANVSLGAFTTYTLTIVDNDTAPVITPVPSDLIVAVGATPSWVAGATGSDPLTTTWKKGTVVLATTPNFTLSHLATLADAGAYTFTAANNRSTVTKTVQLAVVDQAPRTVKFDLATTATLSVVLSGTPVTYQWYKYDGGANTKLNNGTKYANATTKTLSIKSLAITDRDDYFCTVTMGSGHVNGGSITLQVPNVQPNSVAVAFPDCVAYNTYPTYPIPFDCLPV